MTKVKRIGEYNIGVSDVSELLTKGYKEDRFIKKMKWAPGSIVSKATDKIIVAPYAMDKLLKLTEIDEYHSGCISAIVNACLMQIKVHNKQVEQWLESADFPDNENIVSILAELLKYYNACGNGFLLKMRNSAGEWTGLERLLPSQIAMVEKYDNYGFFKPDYIQVKNGLKKLFLNKDVIHFKKPTYKSNGWGLACIPIVINIEMLEQIRVYDYNDFKNGLLVDYFLIIEGGSLKDDVVVDNDGNELQKSAFDLIQEALISAKGSNKAHSTILIELDNKDAKIRLEPLRRQDRDGGFISLKKDLRDGILAYHRVPARIVSQTIPGQLGGDNKSDMIMFYYFVIKPIQHKLGQVLATEFNKEFGWRVKASDFDFGDLSDLVLDADERAFKTMKS